MQMCTDSWPMASHLAGWLGTWEKRDWNVGDKEIWGRRVDRRL